MSNPVSDATSTIKDNLDQGLFDWDVTHGELIENNEAVANLTPEQRNELVANLSDDDLKNWTQEIDGMNGALSSSERQDLFNQLAEGLDAEQLTRLVEAFDGSPGGREALGNAVAQHSSSETKLAFIEATKGSINADYSASQGRYGNAETVVIGNILASLSSDPQAMQQAVGSLSDSQLQDVLEVGLGRTYVSQGPSTFVEPSVTVAILNGVAGISDPVVKGRVFEAGAQQIETLREQTIKPLGGADQPTAQVVQALTNLINSDPNGVVTELRTRTDVGGGALVAYTQEMIDGGKKEDVQNLLVQLQQGNGGTGNAFENFSDPDVARNLGYFTGAAAAAINNITDDAQAQGDLLKNIFGAGFGAVGAANVPAGVIASVGNGITSQVIDGVIDDVKDGNKELKQALYELAMPRGPDGAINSSGTGYDAFNAAFAAVAEVNR